MVFLFSPGRLDMILPNLNHWGDANFDLKKPTTYVTYIMSHIFIFILLWYRLNNKCKAMLLIGTWLLLGLTVVPQVLGKFSFLERKIGPISTGAEVTSTWIFYDLRLRRGVSDGGYKTQWSSDPSAAFFTHCLRLHSWAPNSCLECCSHLKSTRNNSSSAKMPLACYVAYDLRLLQTEQWTDSHVTDNYGLFDSRRCCKTVG